MCRRTFVTERGGTGWKIPQGMEWGVWERDAPRRLPRRHGTMGGIACAYFVWSRHDPKKTSVGSFTMWKWKLRTTRALYGGGPSD